MNLPMRYAVTRLQKKYKINKLEIYFSSDELNCRTTFFKIIWRFRHVKVCKLKKRWVIFHLHYLRGLLSTHTFILRYFIFCLFLFFNFLPHPTQSARDNSRYRLGSERRRTRSGDWTVLGVCPAAAAGGDADGEREPPATVE